MWRKIIVTLVLLCSLVIILAGVIYFLPSSLLPNIAAVDSIKGYVCSMQKGDYRCSYGWGKVCHCEPRYKDGGKLCTNSSQCTSNKCLLKASQLSDLGYDLYPNTNVTNAHGDYKNCYIKDIDKLPSNLGQNGECQMYSLDILGWGCVGVLNDGSVKFECGCAVQ